MNSDNAVYILAQSSVIHNSQSLKNQTWLDSFWRDAELAKSLISPSSHYQESY